MPKQDIYILQWMKCGSREKRCIFQVQTNKDVYFNWRDVLFLSGSRQLENEMYISSKKMYISIGEMYYSYLVAARYIWRPPVRK